MRVSVLVFLYLSLCIANAGIAAIGSATNNQANYQAMVLTTPVPDGTYYNPGCIGNDIVINPCAGCIGQVEQTINFNSTQLILEGMVLNPRGCASFVTHLRLGFGLQSAVLNLSGTNISHTLFSIDNGPTVGVQPFVMCCSEITNWNGTFVLGLTKISGVASVTLDLLVPQVTDALPLQDYYQAVPATIVCNGAPVACQSGCPINVVATEDPMLTYWSTIMKNRAGQEVPELDLPASTSLSSLVWTSYIPPGDTVDAYQFGIQALQVIDGTITPSCGIAYANLYDSADKPVVLQNNWAIAEPQCTSSDFREYFNAFEATLRLLDTSVVDFVTLALIDLASSYPRSLLWHSCWELSLSYLEGNLTNPTQQVTCTKAYGSIDWANDPCCNVTLQNTLCCLPQEQTLNYTEYTYSDSADFSTCITPNCIQDPLQILAQVSKYSTQATCSADRIAAANDARFTNNPYDECYGKAFGIPCSNSDVACKGISDTSICVNGFCLVPCESGGTCINGNCILDPVYGNLCTNSDPDPEFQKEAFVNCTLNKIDPYLASLVRIKVEASSTTGSFYDKYLAASSSEACLASTGAQWKIKWPTKETCEADPGYCPWRYCNIGTVSPYGYHCTYDFCNNTLPFSDSFCGYRSPGSIGFDVYGRPDICNIRSFDTGITNPLLLAGNKTLCEVVFGGVWAATNPISTRDYGSCYTRDNSSNACYGVDFCIPGYLGLPCASYCSLGPSPCSGSTTPSGNPLTFQTWTGAQTGSLQSACIVTFPSNATSYFSQCLAEGGTWVAGRDWLLAIAATEATCPSQVCYNAAGFVRGVNNSQCAQAACSTNSSCPTEACCSATVSCNAPIGCRLPTINRLTSSCTWTPTQCLSSGSPQSCLLNPGNFGYQYWNTYTDPASCAAAIQLCNDGTNPDAIIRSPTSQPTGFNLRSPSECQKCGGKMQPMYRWTNEENFWVYSQKLVNMTWAKKELLFPTWRSYLNKGAFAALLDEARSSRLATILLAETFCDYGVEGSLIYLISCACGSDANISNAECFDNLTSPSGIPVLSISACNSVVVSKTTQKLTINVTENFFLEPVPEESACLGLVGSLYSFVQFSYIGRSISSSLAILSETRTARQSANYVFNTEQTAVGVLVDNGYSILFRTNETGRNFTGISYCITLPKQEDVDWPLFGDLTYWDLATTDLSTPGVYVFTPMGMELPLNTTEACVQFAAPVLVFPIGLVKYWQGATVYSSWPQEEKGLMIFCTITFLFVIIWTLFNLEERIRNNLNGNLKRAPVPVPEIALFCVVVLASLSVTNLLMTLTGYYQGSYLDPLLFDLPALCLLTCVTAIISTWESILFAGKSVEFYQSFTRQALPFVFLTPLYLAFIGLLVASQSTATEDSFTCATTDSEKNSYSISQRLSISYKAIFAMYAFLLLVAFLFYSVRLFQLLKKWKSLRMAVIKNSIASVSIVASLMILVAITLYTTTQTMKNTTILAFTIAVLIQPCYAITYLYSYQSSFTAKIISWTISPTGKKSSTSKPTTSQSDVK